MDFYKGPITSCEYLNNNSVLIGLILRQIFDYKINQTLFSKELGLS